MTIEIDPQFFIDARFVIRCLWGLFLASVLIGLTFWSLHWWQRQRATMGKWGSRFLFVFVTATLYTIADLFKAIL